MRYKKRVLEMLSSAILGWIVARGLDYVTSLPFTLPSLSEEAAYGVILVLTLVTSILLLVDSIMPSFFQSVRFRLSRQTFQAEVVGAKAFRVGDAVRLKARFRDRLENGFFTAQIFAPDGATLPEGKHDDWWPNKETFVGTTSGRVGTLRGDKTHESEWEHSIPSDYPVGRYKVRISVFDVVGGKTIPVKEIEDFFRVESPKKSQI